MPIEAQLSATMHAGPETKPVVATPLPETTRTITPRQDNNIMKLHSAENNEASSNDFAQKINSLSNRYVSKINGILHTIASLTSLGHGSSGAFGKVNKFFDKLAFVFTKFVAPILSYGTRAVSAFKQKNIFETVIKAIPPILMPFIGDANVDVVYGLSTGFNCIHDLAQDNLNTKSAANSDYAAKAAKSKESFSGHAKLLLEETKEMIVKCFKGELDAKQTLVTLGSFLILGGAAPIILFARKARDTVLARACGLARSIGGGIGDVVFALYKNDPHRNKVGILCGIASVCDIAKRWVGEKWGQILIHAAAAFNVSGYAAWNSRDGNKGAVVS